MKEHQRLEKGEISTCRAEQGTNIPNLNATNIKLGTVDHSRLPEVLHIWILQFNKNDK